MACELTILFLVLILISHVPVDGEPQVPCYFIFGDSLVDNGNNNLLPTTAKANYPPYGIDFYGPTGRFCNGRNMADFIAEFLGFETFIPPFATARGQDILTGVNYGSGGSGIRDETGQQLIQPRSNGNTSNVRVHGEVKNRTLIEAAHKGARISMNRQLLNHQITISSIASLLGSEGAAKNYLSQCIYSVGMGNNDYINNYLMPQFYSTSYLYTPDQYADVLIQQYSKQLKTLYNYGARKVAIFGLGLIGCTPAEIARYGTNGSACVDKINMDVQLFNNRIKILVDGINNDLPNAKFTYINITEISSGDPSGAGITVINAPCCIVLTNGQCAPNQVPCSDRNKYVFFDGLHPTEIVNFLLAIRSYSAQTPFDAYPVDIKGLAQL